MKKILLLSIITVFQFITISRAQTQVFSDNFNRADLSISTPTTYTTTVTAGDGGASINSSSFLELTNDVTVAAQVAGRVYVTGLLSDFSSPFSSTLSSNAGLVTWTFNFRYNRSTAPSGFGLTSYGIGIVLACDGSDLTTANGYAIAYGQSGNDPIKLVRFAGGLDADANLTDIITSGIVDITSVNNYVSVRVTFNPANNNWSLYLRDDGSSSWSDPSSGVTSQIGSNTANSTYTSSIMANFGFFWNYNTAATQKSQFENFKVTVQINPVTNVSLTGTGSGTGQVSWSVPTIYTNSNNETIVFLKDGSAITEGTASNNISSYTSNASFGNGTQYQNDAGAYCVYKGDGTSVDLTNVTDGHTYYALIFNTNGNSSYSSSSTNNAPLPVELTFFRLSVVGKKVNLSWRTATEVNNYGFEVERRQTSNVKSETWEKIGFVNGNGNSNSPKSYSFSDEPYGGKEFKYRLKQIDFDGKFEYTDEVTAVFEDVTTFELEQNYPNPFNPSTKISYTIPQRSNVKLRVYNMLAQMEAELVNESQEAGHYQVIFNGSNLPSGTYFYKLEAGKFVEVKKFLLVK